MRDDIELIIVLLLLNIILTIRSTMLGLYSSVWTAEGKIGLVSCYATSLNVLSGILLVGTLILGISYLKGIPAKKFLNKFLIILLTVFGVFFFYFWIGCDLNISPFY